MDEKNVLRMVGCQNVGEGERESVKRNIEMKQCMVCKMGATVRLTTEANKRTCGEGCQR